jgi:glutathione S-transferase
VAIRRLLEENLYWALIYLRWIDDAGFAAARQAFFAALPAPLRLIVPPLARRSVRQEIHGHGLGRHRPEEIMAIGCTDLTALAELLGEQAYFLGDAPTTLDASAYAFLANILVFPEDSPLARHARSLPALPAYCRRMRERYFSASPR